MWAGGSSWELAGTGDLAGAEEAMNIANEPELPQFLG